MSGEILFYSDFPLGYHNHEAEEKMTRFARRGWRVHYVEQLGIRNPTPAHAGRLLRRLAARGTAVADGPGELDLVSPRLLAPRRAPGVGTLNRHWLRRQLLPRLDGRSPSVLWVRYPTPELVPLAEDPAFEVVVYEVVDDHARGPGMTPRLRRLFEAAERRLLSRADITFAWSEPLRRRLDERHDNVVLASAAVDVEPFERARRNTGPRPRRAVYTGSVDFRVDARLLADAASLLANWELLIAGPVDDRAARDLASADNVRLLGALPHPEVPPLIASASVCLMPYAQTPYVDNLFPIKAVEYLAAGRPIAATPIAAARQLGGAVATGDDAASFAAAVERAAAADSEADRAARVALAACYSWDARVDQMEAAIKSVRNRG